MRIYIRRLCSMAITTFSYFIFGASLIAVFNSVRIGSCPIPLTPHSGVSRARDPLSEMEPPRRTMQSACSKALGETAVTSTPPPKPRYGRGFPLFNIRPLNAPGNTPVSQQFKFDHGNISLDVFEPDGRLPAS